MCGLKVALLDTIERPMLPYCAADAAFRAEQLKVAVSGWLCVKIKKMGWLYQEEQLTSRKKGRCHVFKEKEAQRKKLKRKYTLHCF
jgi:hypothetical protein